MWLPKSQDSRVGVNDKTDDVPFVELFQHAANDPVGDVKQPKA
jgi:hypothetical protein